MRVRTTWFLVAAVIVGMLAFQAAPAEAQYFPQRWSMVFYDTFGFLWDCVDFARCDSASCPARFFLADHRCSYENNDEFEPGRSRTTITCRDIDLNFYGPMKALTVDLNCTRIGDPFYGFLGLPIGSCGGVASNKRIAGFGNATIIETWAGITIAGRQKCSEIFATGDVPQPSVRSRKPR
jgi:hypothetical protein